MILSNGSSDELRNVGILWPNSQLHIHTIGKCQLGTDQNFDASAEHSYKRDKRIEFENKSTLIQGVSTSFEMKQMSISRD